MTDPAVPAAPSVTPHTFIVGENGDPIALQDHQAAALPDNAQVISGNVARALEGGRQNNQYVEQNWGTSGQAAMGGFSGLTLGLGPAALAHMGLVDPGHLEAAGNTGAYVAGDIAGMVAPALLSGGESLGARGVIGKALRYATPAGLMGEVGGAAGRLAEHFIGSAGLLGKGAASTLSMAARGATEGALINASHQASQDIIQNKPLAAQSLLAAGADGALFGGLAGGLLGGVSAAAGAGLDAVTGRAGAALAGDGERAAATALKHMGANVEGASSDALIGDLRRYSDVLSDNGGSIGMDTRGINESAKLGLGKYTAIADDAVDQLEKNMPAMTPSTARVGSRIETDVMAHYDGKLEAADARKIVGGLRKDIEGIAQKTMAEPTPPKLPSSRARDYPSATAKNYASAMDAYKEARSVYEQDMASFKSQGAPGTDGGIKTWKNWTDSRETLAAMAEKNSGLKGDIYKTALNAYDSELRAAMDAAEPDLAKTWSAAVVSKRVAEELVEMSSNKVSKELGRPGLQLTPHNASTLSFAVLTGADPIVGLGIVAGQKIVNHIAHKMEPVIAEYAARSALGASAGAAQAKIGQRVSEAMKSFVNGGRQVASLEYASKPKYSMKNYAESVKLADDLTSAQHQAKVKEVQQAMAEAGHPELGNEMALTYGRAVAYADALKPKGRNAETNAGRLGKAAKDIGLSTGAMKFMRVVHALSDPMGAILGGLARGDVSRDAVAAVKYVFPDIHKDIVFRASEQIMALKSEGKFLPADKIATLGTVLDAPVDTTLSKDFITAVQAGLKANQAPPPDGGSSPPPVTDVSAYQTPLQNSA